MIESPSARSFSASMLSHVAAAPLRLKHGSCSASGNRIGSRRGRSAIDRALRVKPSIQWARKSMTGSGCLSSLLGVQPRRRHFRRAMRAISARLRGRRNGAAPVINKPVVRLCWKPAAAPSEPRPRGRLIACSASHIRSPTSCHDGWHADGPCGSTVSIAGKGDAERACAKRVSSRYYARRSGPCEWLAATGWRKPDDHRNAYLPDEARLYPRSRESVRRGP